MKEVLTPCSPLLQATTFHGNTFAGEVWQKSARQLPDEAESALDQTFYPPLNWRQHGFHPLHMDGQRWLCTRML